MSHFTTIATKIRDLEALALACAELGHGVKLVKDAVVRGIGVKQKADYVIRLNCGYDVGVNKQADGTYALVTDWWGGHVEKEVGKNYGKLLQAYGVNKSILEARRKGYQVQRTACKNGTIRVTVMVP